MHHTSAKAKKKTHVSAGGRKGAIRHMTITPAANGFTTETHREPTKGADGMTDWKNEMETNVHPTPEHMAQHVAQTFGAKMQAPDDEGAEDE